MFPPFEEWCDTVLHPEDTHPWNFRTKEFYEEYKSKYTIAKMVQPASILEVGVRFGYGAHAFLSAYPTVYDGLDFDEPSWGPYKGVPRLWAVEMLKRECSDSSINTYGFDTQKQDIAVLDLAPYDMVHIDADHSYEGAARDLNTFWPLCTRVMVVDDYNEILEVKCATEEFVAKHPEALLLTSASLRGSALIVRDT